MKIKSALLLFALFVIGSGAATAAPFFFEVLPSGPITAAPGETVGWGYRVTNPDPVNWLELTSLSADTFEFGTPVALFDFPILMPGATVTVDWQSGVAGLYEFTFDLGTPAGSSNKGTFILSGMFYDGDPLLGGNPFDVADDQLADYEVINADAAVVPEPSTIAMLVAGSGLLLLRRRRR